MRAQVYNRDRFEIEAKQRDGTWVAISHPETLNEAKERYDYLTRGDPSQNLKPLAGYLALRIRHRHIRESVQFIAPDAYEVVISWCEGFEDMPTHHRFFSRERALAFAGDGNKSGVMKSVHCIHLTTGATIFHWPG